MSRTAAANGPAVAPAVETQAEPGLLDRVVEATQRYRYTLPEVQFMAQAASKSGMFGMNESQAFVLMMIAEAKGLHPIEAVQRYHVIHNKPTMRADAMLAEMIVRGWTVDWLSEDDDPNEQTAMWSHPTRQPTPKRVGFTRKQADTAELKSDLWRKYPSNMLRARAISNAVRKFDPGITVGIYAPEEAAEFTDRPSPRPLLADVPASRMEPSSATPEPQTAPAPSEFWAWVQQRVDETNNEWKIEHGLDDKLIDGPWQVIRGVLIAWVKDEFIKAEYIQTNGVRDKDKEKAAMLRQWNDPEDGREVLMNAIDQYLSNKRHEAIAKAKPAFAEPKEDTP